MNLAVTTYFNAYCFSAFGLAGVAHFNAYYATYLSALNLASTAHFHIFRAHE